jgi:excisionase family DNA binding protein
MEEVLDAKAITDKLGIGKNAVYALMKKKGFPSIKVGRKYIVFADDFERYMKNHIGTT